MNTVLTEIGGTIASLLPGDKQNGLAHERTVLSVIGRTVTDPFSRTGVFDRLTDLVGELIKSDRIAITVLDPDRDTFRLVHLRGIEVWDVEPGEGIPLKNSFVAEVVRFDRPMRFNASDQCPQKIGFEMAGLHCRIGTPLRSNDQVIGTLHLSSKEPNAYSERDLSRLEQIGQQISGTVASEFLLKSEQTRTRQLKGMYQVAAILANDQSFKKRPKGLWIPWLKSQWPTLRSCVVAIAVSISWIWWLSRDLRLKTIIRRCCCEATHRLPRPNFSGKHPW